RSATTVSSPTAVSQCPSQPSSWFQPVEVSSVPAGSAKGGDPAADDTAVSRCSPRLETPPSFPLQPSSPPPHPVNMDFGVVGGGDAGGAGSEGAASGGAGSEGAERSDGGGAEGTTTIGTVGALRPLPLPGSVARGYRGLGARGAGGTGISGVGGTGAGGAGGSGAGGARAGGAGGSGAGGGGAGGADVSGAGGSEVGGSGGAAQQCPRRVFLWEQPQSSLPPRGLALHQVLRLPTYSADPSAAGPTPPLLLPPPDPSRKKLPPNSPVPIPSRYPPFSDSLTERKEPASCLASPNASTRRVRPPPVPCTHTMALRPSSVAQHPVLPSPPASSLPDVLESVSNLARAASPIVTHCLATHITYPTFESAAASALVTALFELEWLAAAVPHLVAMMLGPEEEPDALDNATLHSYAEVITVQYSSQWKTAMDAEMASCTSTYVDAVPSPGANIVKGMWIFREKRPPGSPPVFKAHYTARGFTQRQRVFFFQTFSSGFTACCSTM
ncbi:unnamed protein product, partial [Closterium sp. NIES-53]